MKINHAKIVAFGAAALFIVLRILQYVFAMDGDGFFVTDSLWQRLLSYALYVCMGIFVLSAFVFLLGKCNRYPSKITLATGRGVAYLSLLYAVALLVNSVMLLLKKDWLCALTFTAAIYYILLAVRCDRRKVPMLNIMALFALAYPCARIIRTFFDTFKEIKASETVIAVLGQCAVILSVIVLTKLFMEFDENMSKIGFCLMLGVAFGAVAIVSRALAMVFLSGFSTVEIVTVVSDTLFWGMSACLLGCCAKWKPIKTETIDAEELL